MLRTLFVLALVAYGVRHSVRGPFYAVLFYLWIAYFRPEEWVWGGVVQTLPLSLVVGAVAILAGVMSLQLAINGRVLLLGAMVAHSLFSTLSSNYVDFAWPFWTDFAKSIGITWLIVSLAHDVKRIRLVMLVIALSLGFEAAKQGWVQLLFNPGAKNFNEISFIGDNNGVAIAMYVLVAFLVALARTSPTVRERWVHRFVAVGALYRGVVTYSRGGLLACGALAALYFVRSKRKVPLLAGMVIIGMLIVPVLPEEFWERMGTMSAAFEKQDPAFDEVDASFQGRLHFWRVATVMAADHPFTGVGHNAYTRAYDRYDSAAGDYGFGRSVHSSWLGVLAELGYPGMLLLFMNMGAAWLGCRRARKISGDGEDVVHLREFATALEISLVVILVGGTFVIFQYSEVLWHVIGLSFAVQRVAERVAATAPDAVAPPMMTPAVAGVGSV